MKGEGEHEMLTRGSMRCSCGSYLYETNDGRVFCEASQVELPKPWLGRLRHLVGCRRDDENLWHCTAVCPIKNAQMEMSL